MENLSEKQTPDFMEMRKTLVGLGNALIQSGLSDSIEYKHYPTLGWVSFACGDFKYEIGSCEPYNEDEYQAFVESVKDYLKSTAKDYEEQIFALECAKAVIEVYLTENSK